VTKKRTKTTIKETNVNFKNKIVAVGAVPIYLFASSSKLKFSAAFTNKKGLRYH
jgi:hypothetical protein